MKGATGFESTVEFTEHSAKQFVKSRLLDAKYHQWLLEAFSQRITGDYGIESNLTAEDATVLINQAREFLDVARRFLEKENG